MIDEKKLIEYLETLVEFESKKSQESAQIGAFDMATCYGHGEYCYKNAINAAREQPKIGGWIPCSERFPEEDGFYLVTLTEKVTDINDIRVTKIFFSEKSNSFTGYGKSVIAWQPLPEAYHE